MIGVKIRLTPKSAGASVTESFSLHEKLVSAALLFALAVLGLRLSVLLKTLGVERHSCKTSITPTAPNRHSTLNPFATIRIVFIVLKNNKFLETTRFFIHKVLLTKTFYASGKTITLAKRILVRSFISLRPKKPLNSRFASITTTNNLNNEKSVFSSSAVLEPGWLCRKAEASVCTHQH